jgi:hypothetical protein
MFQITRLIKLYAYGAVSIRPWDGISWETNPSSHINSRSCAHNKQQHSGGTSEGPSVCRHLRNSKKEATKQNKSMMQRTLKCAYYTETSGYTQQGPDTGLYSWVKGNGEPSDPLNHAATVRLASSRLSTHWTTPARRTSKLVWDRKFLWLRTPDDGGNRVLGNVDVIPTSSQSRRTQKTNKDKKICLCAPREEMCGRRCKAPCHGRVVSTPAL